MRSYTGLYSTKRVRQKHTQIKSIYNTYQNRGLPPGPICTPSKVGIQSVLEYEKHEYYYFCAKPDYSGLHAFSKNFSEHIYKARIYRRWLTKEGY
ncbi:MAG: endolytic transglycosylase MltG [Bacteroidales bacterium]